MSKRLLLVLLLAVPAAGAGVSALLASGVERAGGRPADTLSGACADPRVLAAAADACALRSYDDLLRVVSIPAGLLGASWLLVVSAAGLVARRSRTLLLRLFVPGLHATSLVAAILVLATASVAVAPVPLLLTKVGGGGPVKVVLVVLVVAGAALGGVAALLRASFSVVRRAAPSVLGRAVAERDAPALWALVREVSCATRAEAPDHLVLGLEPRFFVTEAPVRCVDGLLAGRTMYLSLPLCRILRVDEVRAILGHELAHFVGQDTAFSRRFFPVYRGTAAALQGLSAAGDEGAASLAALPAASLLSFFLDAFAAAERDLSRARELAADEAGARVTSAAVMATALVKVHAFSDAWSAAERAMADGLRAGKVCENASALFADIVVANASPERLAGLDGLRLAHPTDSHPPLADRLGRLGTSLCEVSARALEVDPEDPAIGLVAGLAPLERELGAAEQLLLARGLGEGSRDQRSSRG
jgi:Zn-dependent protease with chaperone function